MKQVKIYTDGACSGNGSKDAVAGWAFVVTEGTQSLAHGLGRIKNGTNNIGEMTAIIEALKYVLEHENDFINVELYSDSSYCINGILTWRHSWKQHNWTRKGKELKNAELWKEIDDLLNIIDCPIEFHHIAGHSGHFWNEYVDRMAKDEI